MDPSAVDSPNLMEIEPIESPFPGMFGDWVVQVPTVEGSKTTVVGYRHLPLPGWEQPLWTTEAMANDVRYEANDRCKVYTYD